MNEEQKKLYKEEGSNILRKTLKDLDVTTLDALGSTLLTLRVLFDFMEKQDCAIPLVQFFRENEMANEMAPVFVNTVNLMEIFHQNIMDCDKLA